MTETHHRTSDPQGIWTAGRIMWLFVAIVEVIFTLQVLFSDQRWESVLVMIAVNVFLLPVIGILFAILGAARKFRARREARD